MTVREKVLHALLESEKFISGEQLSVELGVSRTSVWKAIKKLKEDGFNIKAVNNKGYKMTQNPDGLVESLLTHDLTKRGFDMVRLFDTIDSTNLEAKRQAESFSGNGIFIAKEQTLGKGRRGRTWESPKGTGNYMSYLLRPEIEPMAASMLTLIAGLAVCNSMIDLYEIDVRIKWPNDIVIGGKKLCGILTEVVTAKNGEKGIIAGVGINVNQGKAAFSGELSELATSVKLESGKKIPRLPFLGSVMKYFEDQYFLFQKGEFKELIRRWKSYSSMLGRDVGLKVGNRNVKGTVLDLEDSGALVLRLDSGKTESFFGSDCRFI